MASFENAPEQQGGMLEAALLYATQGAPVFPCKLDKSPRPDNGFYAATTDEGQIRRWWAAHPDDLIAVPTGAASGTWVLDVDNGETGRTALARLEAEHGRIPETYRVRTSGDPKKDKGPGEHIYL